MNSHNQFYINRYNKFISNCILPADETYFENHHIIPKCMGGKDDESNLIKLTARQHFIAHWMLWKAYKTNDLAYAFFLMNVVNKNHIGRKKRINSKTYSLLKEHKSQNQSLLNSERWKNEEWAKKQKLILSQAASTPIESKRRSKSASETNKKYKDQKSKRHKALWNNKEWAENSRKKMIENHPRTKAIIVDGVEYSKAEEVAKKFNITKPGVRYRINSLNPLYSGWSYKT